MGTRGAPKFPFPALSAAPGEQQALVCGSCSLFPLSTGCHIPFPVLSSAEKPKGIFYFLYNKQHRPSGLPPGPRAQGEAKLQGAGAHSVLQHPAELWLLQPWALPHPGASVDAQMPLRNLLLPDRCGQGGTGGFQGTELCYRRG